MFESYYSRNYAIVNVKLECGVNEFKSEIMNTF